MLVDGGELCANNRATSNIERNHGNFVATKGENQVFRFYLPQHVGGCELQEVQRAGGKGDHKKGGNVKC